MTSKTSDWRPGPTVCRCCLTEGCYKDISTEYFWMGKREVYAEMLSDTLSVTIGYAKSGPNSNSRLICEPCISRLRDAHDFRRQVLECEKTFMQHLDPGSSSILGDVSLEEVKIERVKQEKKLSDDEDFDDRVDFVVNDDTDDDLDDEPLMKLATKVPKKEKKDKEVDLLELIDSTQITVKRKSTASSSKAKEPPAKKAKKREIVIKPSASKAKASASSTGEKKKKGPVTLKRRRLRAFPDERRNAAVIIQCSNVCPFKWNRSLFCCSYCSFSSGDFDILKDHMEEHPNRLEILRGLRPKPVKADISDLRCTLCNRNIKDIPTLVDHLVEVHGKFIDDRFDHGIVPYLLEGDIYKCAICNDSFDLFIHLNKHINEHFPNSTCPLCGQSFAEESRLKSHILYVHKKEKQLKYSCTKCGETFTSSLDKDRHKNLYHGILKYRCPHCEESFHSYVHRVKHMKEVHDKKIEYPCSLCPATFLLCSERTKHFRLVHLKDKRFPCPECPARFFTRTMLKNHMVKHTGEKNFQCEVCEKCYTTAKVLKEHMRIHNDDRRFVCDYCDKAFVQKCSLKGHVRTHHPEVEFLTVLE